MPGRLAYPPDALMAAGAPAGTAPLSARVPAKVSRRAALTVLARERRAAWLGDLGEHEIDGDHDRYLVDLELRVSENTPRITFHKAAYVDVGPLRAGNVGPIEVPISWRAAGLAAPLFPVFSGTLSWADEELSLHGYYAPPGGELGIMADRLLLNVAARGTARLLLEKIAAAMLGEAA